ncbi:hypothetical protein XAP6164_1820016 [Xanthomonas phaseoli pv. phaseoli]|nr:hypothetical protein XAP6164_1820016 [Xanthomonas phaseoli pv. phaseoli]
MSSAVSASTIAAIQRLPRRAGQLGGQLGGGGWGQVLGELGVDATAFGEVAVGGIGGALHHHHEFALALVVVGLDLGLQLRQAAVEHGFEQLGEFAGDHCRTLVTEGKAQVGQRFDDAVGGLVEHQGAGLAGQPRQALAAGGALGRQEAFETEAVAGQAGHAERGDRGAGAGHRADLDAGGTGGAHQLETGVADQRSAGVADDGQRRAFAQARHDALGHRVFVVVVQRQQRAIDAEMAEQLAGMAGVFGADRGHATQHFLRARRQVGQVADRRGDHVQGSRGRHQRCSGGKG